MELLASFVDLFIHLDKYLVQIINTYQGWTYAILFLVIFCETGLVVTPLLPGDSLLFAAGAFAAIGELNVAALIAVLAAAAILGDTVNYAIGHKLGGKVFNEKSRFFKRDHLLMTERFYEKHGGKTIIFARFMPIIRTFAPFVAGVGSMSYPRFLAYNVAGGIAWVLICTLAGYFFGNIPAVKENFTLVILGIIFVSILPGVIHYLKHLREQRRGGVGE